MMLAVTLFVFRILSAVLLLALLLVLLWVMWRDYQRATAEVEASRRVYGTLTGLREVDNQYVPTGDLYPLVQHTSLGRAPTNTIRVEDQFASSEHASLMLRGGVWWLEDHGSRNGTGLNGMLINQPVIITDGDIINIGARYFRVELKA